MYCCIEKEENKVFMVAFANTIANPWAMMIHPHNALPADRAVVNSFFLYNIAFKAEPNLA